MEKISTYNINGRHLTLEQLCHVAKRWLDARPILSELAGLQDYELPMRVPPLREAAHQLLTRDQPQRAIDSCQPKTP